MLGRALRAAKAHGRGVPRAFSAAADGEMQKMNLFTALNDAMRCAHGARRAGRRASTRRA